MRRAWLRELRCDDSPEPRCRPETVAGAVAEIGEAATAWAVRTADRSARAALAKAYGDQPSPLVIDPVRAVCEACVLALLRGLYRGIPAESAQAPVEATESAREAVHAGLPLERLLRTMWNAHLDTVDALLQDMRDPVGVSWPDEAREIGRLSFAFLDAFSDWVVHEYNTERDAWLGSRAAARRELVATVLDRGRVEVEEAEAVLGIRLAGPLLGAVIWSDRPGAVPDHDLHALAAALARAAGAGAPLVVQGAPSVLWAWLPLPGRPRADLGEHLRGAVPAPPGLRAALGPPAPGLTGLRRTHLAALRAHDMSTARPWSWLTDYRSVAVLSLLTTDPEEAWWFAHDVLGELAGTGQRCATLRETLRVYLATGRGRRATAERLHVAPGTVAYRVRQAEQLMGRSVDGIDRDTALALEVLQVPLQTRGGPDPALRPAPTRPHPRADAPLRRPAADT